MEIARYLAMTADEFAADPHFPGRKAWMACHFSPYSTSLSNLPTNLPGNSLLILNDSTPPSGQAPEEIAKSLEIVLKKHNCSGLLVDFQRLDCQDSLVIVQELLKLDFQVCVSEMYAKNLDCPVFLPPVPLTVPLTEYLAPWRNREIWLDAALSCEQINVTETGSSFYPLLTAQDCTYSDKELHCHYRIEKADDSFIFTLQRTKEDLGELLSEAETLGVSAAVGLYQELK